ncbi:glycosyltransferase [Sphingobium indicum]|uniref:Glycosyl transferase family 1 n=2 Tax=Sphingobium indicum TaxID=332055 RepID=A0A1L5BP37_SPHIB|nr:glycosyltransferase [Sphingobium indicum]APL94664.1 glycosyl transferase family 1 [Sphingobium indicum B90A]NYI23196.1 glycosyltransferase involved in cell wall biosynthesis [Sphingobium indicum]RYM04408.1 glycosyltransferase [Sphingobium indicum]
MIVIYVHALTATGVVRNARLLAAALAERGHRVELVTAAPGGEGVPGVRHFPLLQRSHASSLIEKLIAIRALRRHLRRRRSSLLISAGNHGHFVAWAASRGLGGPRRVYRISNDMVRAIPGAPHGGSAGWERRIMTHLIAADADRIVLVSPTLAAAPAFAAAAREGRVAVIPNGIDAAAARARAEGPAPHGWMTEGVPVILAIGRLARQKNFETLLRAFATLRQSRRARLIILGESRDRMRDRLMALARRLGVADDLALPGVVANVFPWLAHADAFILPSWWEGSPNVLLEAMAVGVPVVASCTAGNAADLLDGGRFGRLVDPADAAAMADALLGQIDPARAVLPGDRIDAFSLDRVRAAWMNIVERRDVPACPGKDRVVAARRGPAHQN